MSRGPLHASSSSTSATSSLSLPIDVWITIVHWLRPVDIISLRSTCTELLGLPIDWEGILIRAARDAVLAITVPRALKQEMLHFDRRLILEVAQRAISLGGAVPATSPHATFFLAILKVPEAAVALVAREAPGLCLVCIDDCAYDTSDYVTHHPGGEHLMREHHGIDASYVFDAFAHSLRAHDLMRKHMLRFCATTFVGRAGAPYFAREAAPQVWSFSRDTADVVSHLSPSLYEGLRALSNPFLEAATAGAAMGDACRGGKLSMTQLCALTATAVAALGLHRYASCAH